MADAINLRRRLVRRSSQNEDRWEPASLFHIDMGKGRSSSVLPITALCSLFSIGMALFIASLLIIYDLPTPIVKDVEDAFNSHRAMAHLTRLESFGPKVTGSFENEVMAVSFIVRSIVEIQKDAKDHHNMTYEVQRVNGSFHLSEPISETLVYFFVQNIIVRLSPAGNSLDSPSLLINCHFDSVPTSPGASDDGANCAIMLETLRVLSLGPRLQHDVIFLFNGAEENPLMASHGFITKYPWANNNKAFINLESCGAGGKEVLFQSGPRNTWLLEKYAQVPHPSALVVAEEIFQSGLVPSDTDFRIFRDYGEIPGLDFAHCLNGYVYHTKYDQISSIVNALGVLQHTGDNLLSLIRSIVNSDDFGSTPKFTDANPVYFDVFGKYFFVYDANKSGFNWLVFAFAAGIILLCQPTLNLLKRTITFSITITSAVALNLMIAFLVDYFGVSLSWYTSTALIAQLYFMPPFILSSLILIHMENYFTNRLVNNDCPKRWFSMYLNFLAMHLFWTLIFGVITVLGIRSSYLLVYLIGPNAITLAILYIFRINSGKLWTILYVLSTTMSSINFSYLGILVFYLFIPITGRAGDSKNPDILIGGLSAVLFFAIFSYMLPLMFLVKSNRRFLWTLAAFNLFAVIVTCNTPISFPFSELKPQRLIAKHVNREIYSFNSSIMADSIVWVQSLDRRGLAHYTNPEFKNSLRLDRFCKLDAHCGVPWPNARSYLRSTSSLSFYTAPHKMLTNFTVNYKVEEINAEQRRYSFTVSGQPDHMVIFIRPRHPAELASWTFSSDAPKPRLEYGTYVVRYVHGHQRPIFKFSIDMKHDEGNTQPTMDIAIVAEQIHETKFTDSFTNFISSLPNYAHVTPSVTYYKSYVL